jgi:hypothetical protein
MQFCLCQPDPKIPRPRNGKSILSVPSDLGKSFSIVSFDLERPGQICRTLVNMANVVKAFILYRQHYQAMVVAHNPGLANPEISKIIGEQWRSLSEDDKSKWKALAEVRQPPLCLMQTLTRPRKKKLVISSSTPTIGTSLDGMVGMVMHAMLLQGLVTIQLARPPVTDVVVAL